LRLSVSETAPEALIAFERVLALAPANPASEQNVAMALIESGQPEKAVPHLERCLELDPLLLPAAASLMGVYRQSGDDDKARALSARIRAALSAAGAAPRTRNER
jgi:predicted Zn-dependent protease